MSRFVFSGVLIAALAALSTGCPGSIDAEGIDGFTVSSAHWMVYATGGSRSHELVASNVSGYCAKRKTAEAERQAAFEAHQQRVADGENQCESRDAWYDDMAAAYNPIEGASSSYLRVTLARDVDSSDLDAITAPAAGSYAQLGAGSDGTFDARVQHFQSRYNQELADAWDCSELSEDDLNDATALSLLFASSTQAATPPEAFEISAGQMTIVETSSTKRDVDVSGDILDGGSTVGGLSSSFAATQCEVELADELAF